MKIAYLDCASGISGDMLLGTSSMRAFHSPTLPDKSLRCSFPVCSWKWRR